MSAGPRKTFSHKYPVVEIRKQQVSHSLLAGELDGRSGKARATDFIAWLIPNFWIHFGNKPLAICPGYHLINALGWKSIGNLKAMRKLPLANQTSLLLKYGLTAMLMSSLKCLASFFLYYITNLNFWKHFEIKAFW